MSWSASQLVQLILMCVSTVTQGNQRMTTTWVSCSPCSSPEKLLYCLVVVCNTYWLLSARRSEEVIEEEIFSYQEFISRSVRYSALSFSFFLFMPSLMRSLGDSQIIRNISSERVRLGRTVRPGLWVGAEAQSWEPNRLLSSAGDSSSQVNTSLLLPCLGWRVNMLYAERCV